ncbi:hypothetical protein DNX69_00085 [Rhodopseudomonas palustris]|uniref:Uncharacterized protein n=1 Tax=Rhodopseudomonas palustris TaxID=1076 RepID=A0A323UMJ4_RHOPL|nr:hypothetical protein [Rhodopseudomonas palustris]PZA13875.1 hypothetical protein DNX69_00085 [Rhodopseudomonas palustris]
MRSFQHRDYFFHPCGACGAAANLTRNSPAPGGRERRTYECRRCGQVDVYDVAADSAVPWIVVDGSPVA